MACTHLLVATDLGNGGMLQVDTDVANGLNNTNGIISTSGIHAIKITTATQTMTFKQSSCTPNGE